MSNNKFLSVPIYLEALSVKEDDIIDTVGPLLDFTQLPWTQTGKNRNAPYLSETIAKSAFDSQYNLQPGLHFHWSLPLALTTTSNIGLIYKQSFESVFGKGEKTEVGSGDNIWEHLCAPTRGTIPKWMPVFHEDIGMAVTSLPSKAEIANRLGQSIFLAPYAEAIEQLLFTAVFPPVPNRWLLRRVKNGTVISTHKIESDYLWPIGQETDGDKSLSDYYTSYPMLTDEANEQPYRYLGRSYPAETPPAIQKEEGFLSTPLTAVGYGEPSFAAFYPNCRSVFGHFDRKGLEDDETYELIGWYDKPEHDYFKIFVDKFNSQWKSDHSSDVHKKYKQLRFQYLDLLDAIHRDLRIEVPVILTLENQEKLQNFTLDSSTQDGPKNALDCLQKYLWINDKGQLLPKAYDTKTPIPPPLHAKANQTLGLLNTAIQGQMPDRMLCYARCSAPGKAEKLPALIDGKVKIAVGNSPTEALSALLASEISSKKKSIIEDQLEAIQFESALQHTSVDVGPEFEALRHRKQFHPVAGATEWRVKTRTHAGKQAPQIGAGQEVTLPKALANELNLLNKTEDEINRCQAAIKSLRSQIFADWCWYLRIESQLKRPPLPLVWGNQGQGNFGNQDQVQYGDQDTGLRIASKEEEEAEKKFEKKDWKEIRKFIEAEIGKLEKKLGEEKVLRERCIKQLEKIYWDLYIYQDEAQLLTVEDIRDWDGFLKELEERAPKVEYRHFNVIPGMNEVEVLGVINGALKGLFPFGQPDKYEDKERKGLRETIKNLKSKEHEKLIVSLRLRMNRLTLESWCPNSLKHRPSLELTSQSGARYWRPNDPTLLVSGMHATPRHKNNSISTLADLVDIDIPANNALDNQPGELFTKVIPTNPTQTETNQRHPIFMDWDMDFSQARTKGDLNYSPGYLQDHYQLGDTDLALTSSDEEFDKALSYDGRSILTPGASLTFRKVLVKRLVPMLYQQFLRDKGEATIALFNTWLKGLTIPESNLPQEDPDLTPETQIKDWLTQELDTPDEPSLENRDRTLVKHLDSYLQEGSPNLIVHQFFQEKTDFTNLLNEDAINAFADWAEKRMHIKASYVADHPVDEPLDIALLDGKISINHFVKQLTEYLGESLDQFYIEKEIETAQQTNYLEEHYNEAISWFQPQVSEALQLVVEIRAFQALIDLPGLAQVLGGFSDALLTRRRAYQLPISNPVPLEEDSEFVIKVRQAVQTANTYASDEYLPFSPWRAGKLAINRLRLVDNFGRIVSPEESNGSFPMIAADTMASSKGEPTSVCIPPRLAQAARVNFHWLAADSEIEEMNEHPASNPICGWIVPNNLDSSLMIYAPDGQALGYIDEAAHWRTFPGNAAPVIPADIDHPALAGMVQWLVKQGKDFITDFISALDSAQENMEPESFSQHEDIALLMGRPLALVRADVSIGLQQPPAMKQSYGGLERRKKELLHPEEKADDEKPTPTFNFEKVRIPLRLGDDRRLDDGLAGYWREDQNGQFVKDYFYAVQSDPLADKNPKIITRHDGEETDPFELFLAPDASAPQKLCMLVDPRAAVHIASGALPVQAIKIPADQYAIALRRLTVAFLTAPILAPELGIELSLPAEGGYSWDWVQQEGQHWSLLSAEGVIRKHQLAKYLKIPVDTIWQTLLQAGWLRATEPDTAQIVPADQRTAETLPEAYTHMEESINLSLERLRIRPFDPLPDFSSNRRLIEGWLRMWPLEKQ